jgi:hypothetical protein
MIYYDVSIATNNGCKLSACFGMLCLHYMYVHVMGKLYPYISPPYYIISEGILRISI